MSRMDKALERKRELGKEADNEVFQYLKREPASTIYEIAKGLGWTTGKVQGSINRLKSQLGDKLVVEDDISTGRLKRKYDIRE